MSHTEYDDEYYHRINNVLKVNHLNEPDENGRNPYHQHLVMFEIEPHYGSYILTAHSHSGNALISSDDAKNMFGDQFDDEFCYCSDEYLTLLENNEE